MLAFPEINFPPSENTDHNGMDMSCVKVSAAVLIMRTNMYCHCHQGGHPQAPPMYTYKEETKHKGGTLNRDTLKKS